MSTKKIYDLAVAVGKYTKDGQEKNRYQTVGAVMQKDDGCKFILLERWFNPAGVPYDAGRGNSIMVSMFDPNKQGQGTGPSGGSSRNSSAGDDDDMPF